MLTEPQESFCDLWFTDAYVQVSYWLIHLLSFSFQPLKSPNFSFLYYSLFTSSSYPLFAPFYISSPPFFLSLLFPPNFLSWAARPLAASSIYVFLLFLFIFTAVCVKVPSDSIPVSQSHSDLHPYSRRGGRSGAAGGGGAGGVWDEPSPTRFTSLPRTISPPSSVCGVQGSIPFGACLLRVHPTVYEKKKKKKSNGRVCLGSCQQRSREIYVLVLEGTRAFDPCSVIFYCVRDTTR